MCKLNSGMNATIFFSETYLDVSREALYEVLTDFEQFEKFTSAIVESRNTEPNENGQPGFYTRMEGCVLLFCKSLIRNGYLILIPRLEIVAISIPEESDFKYSRERWQLIDFRDGTIMIYDFDNFHPRDQDQVSETDT